MYYKKAALTTISSIAAASAVIGANSILLTQPTTAQSPQNSQTQTKTKTKTTVRVIKVTIPAKLVGKLVNVTVTGPKNYKATTTVYAGDQTIYITVPKKSQYNIQINQTQSQSTPAIEKPIPTPQKDKHENDKNENDNEYEEEEEDEYEEEDEPKPKPTPTPTPTPTPNPTPTPKPGTSGTYQGVVTNPGYGPIQVQITLTNGKLTAVKTLKYPIDIKTSATINKNAIPKLEASALKSNGTNVSSITGATYTIKGFKNSLQSALLKAGV